MTKRKKELKAADKQKPAEAAPPVAEKTPAAKAGSEKRKLYANTKQALLVEMLSKKSGATIDAIASATDWLPHTSRAMISGLRKAGYKIETEPGKDGKAIYRVTGPARKATSHSRAKA
jgi:hypothetical protein